MSEPNGLAVCRRIREAGDPATILFLTVRDSRSDLEPGFTLEASDYMAKPFDIRELLDNALKYTPSGGAVTMSARADAGRLSPTVQDAGEGIPPDDLPCIFDKLYRARRARGRPMEGSGPGLTMARQIARAHGGDIAVESAPGRGTTFTLALPV